MNLYGREFFTDSELTAEIKAYAKGKRALTMGEGVAKIQGEGRLVEFVASNSHELDHALAEMMYEARQRGLPIGGMPLSAIAVEFVG